MNIGSRRGVWGNRVSPYLSGCGPEARAPRPRPLGGFGRAQPSQEQRQNGYAEAGAHGEGLGGRSPPRNNRMFIAALCGAAAWTADVNIGSRRGVWGNRVSPSLSGRGPEARAPRPRPLGGFGRAQPLRRGMGKPGGPTSPPAGGPGPHAGVGGNRVSPYLRPREGEGAAFAQGDGETGWPHVPARGRAWPSRRGRGKPGFPPPPPAGGSGRAQPSQEGCSSRRCAAQAAWMANVDIGCWSQSLSHKRMWRRSPPPSLPPLGGGAGLPPPAGEGQGAGGHLARGAAPRAGRPRSQAICMGRGAPYAWGLT